MSIAELRDKTVEELGELEGTLRRELWQARFENYTNQLDDTAKIRRTRREIARVKTLLTQQAKKTEGQ